MRSVAFFSSSIVFLGLSACGGAPSEGVGSTTVAEQALTSEPSTIYNGPVSAIAQDDKYIFLGAATDMDHTTGGIIRVDRANPSNQVTIADGSNPDVYPGSIALDDSYVYYSDTFAGTVKRVPKSGGSTTVIANQQTEPRSVFVDSKNLYFATSAEVKRVAKGGGTPTTIAWHQESANDVVADSKYVYWATYHTVARAPIAGGASVTIARTDGAIPAIAIDSSSVYFVDNPSYGLVGSIRSVPKIGGKVTTVATNQSIPMDLAVDGSYVYWANSALTDYYTNAGSVVRWTKGSSPVTIADKQWGPLLVTARGSSVVWVNVGETGSGTVVAVH